MATLPESYADTSKVQQKTNKFINQLAFLAIAFGIIIRLAQYISNRSLWGDEAYIALNIVDRSYLELLQPLDYDQAAPPGFLWIEKLAVQLFGNNEYSLRLFPLIAGIVSLLALYQIGKWTVSAIALPISLILFSCLKYPLYYATEVKQYSSDIMVGLLLCLLLIPLRDRILKKSKVFLLGFLGIVAMWFSHTAIFPLGGVELACLITSSPQKRKAIVINRLPAYLIWLIGFALYYLFIISKSIKNESLQSAWSPEYPKSIFDILWLLDSIGRFFHKPLGFVGVADGIAILAFIIGGITLYRSNRINLLILISPILATLTATYLHKYPFRTRLILFLTPYFILIIAEGAAFLLSQLNIAKFNQTKRRNYVGILGVIISCSLILPASFQAGKYLFQPETKYELRPVIAYIKAHQQPNDVLFGDGGGASAQLEYYAGKYGYSKSQYVLGYNDFLKKEEISDQVWSNFQKQFNQLQNQPRVWFLFSGIGLKDKRAEIVEPRLDRIGQKITYFEQPGAFTYLYQLK
ncbi:glycosyltransferase family 39 protein [Floridanema evergladense]|uniref:Glycosyltransferase family 39 protein n=1 Tax=Floridaenema evergladense BLCC-F167 TaxID=3153639 RepID=A0ABV4WUW3_9CYAN